MTPDPEPHHCEDDFHFEQVGRCLRERVCNVCHRRWHTVNDDSSD